MSQSPLATPASDPLDSTDLGAMSAVDLSALLSSRVCHDLINPVGAISSGLDMIEDVGSDAVMKEMAQDLVKDGTRKALALLSYARLAYGAAGGHGAEIKLEDAQKVLIDLFATTKATLDWQMPDAILPKNQVKVLLILAYAAADAVPRGGNVVIKPSDTGFVLEVTGQRLFLNDEFIEALGGNGHDLKPKFAPAYIAGLLVKEDKGSASAVLEENRVLMTANFQ